MGQVVELNKALLGNQGTLEGKAAFSPGVYYEVVMRTCGVSNLGRVNCLVYPANIVGHNSA